MFSLNAPGTESLEPIPIVEPILVVEPIPVVDPIPPVPILALCELNTIPIPIKKNGITTTLVIAKKTVYPMPI